MKLIKIVYDRSNSSVRQSLIDSQDMHRNIMRFFENSRKSAKVLYRITNDAIYVSSVNEPCITESNGMTVTAMKEMRIPEDGETLRFSLLTRPYKKINGHRIPLIKKDERIKWLYKQSQRYGFLFESLSENKCGIIRSGYKEFEFEAYYYSGIIKVLEKSKFISLLENGIGAEKAYGLGMFMVV